MKKLSAVVLSAMSAFVAFAPMSAFAYLSPEQVFGGQSLTLQPAPPLQREGEDVVTDQQQRAAERRAAEQQGLQSIDQEPTDDYVAPDNTPELGLFDDEVQYERRQDRLDDMHGAAGNGPTIIIGGDGTVVDSNGNVLHSGAPLVTKTGPESILVIGAMVLAAACTLGYSFIRNRKLHA